eukprot:GHVQ01035738.1.p1 GENE.GHVQ01035738.1~~GHVQ01035738.1.p1  ORF type:complete len:734 (+),score=104.35 GHVQ01035738.1:235-2202(+)
MAAQFHMIDSFGVGASLKALASPHTIQPLPDVTRQPPCDSGSNVQVQYGANVILTQRGYKLLKLSQNDEMVCYDSSKMFSEASLRQMQWIRAATTLRHGKLVESSLMEHLKAASQPNRGLFLAVFGDNPHEPLTEDGLRCQLTNFCSNILQPEQSMPIVRFKVVKKPTLTPSSPQPTASTQLRTYSPQCERSQVDRQLPPDSTQLSRGVRTPNIPPLSAALGAPPQQTGSGVGTVIQQGGSVDNGSGRDDSCSTAPEQQGDTGQPRPTSGTALTESQPGPADLDGNKDETDAEQPTDTEADKMGTTEPHSQGEVVIEEESAVGGSVGNPDDDGSGRDDSCSPAPAVTTVPPKEMTQGQTQQQNGDKDIDLHAKDNDTEGSDDDDSDDDTEDWKRQESRLADVQPQRQSKKRDSSKTGGAQTEDPQEQPKPKKRKTAKTKQPTKAKSRANKLVPIRPKPAPIIIAGPAPVGIGPSTQPAKPLCSVVLKDKNGALYIDAQHLFLPSGWTTARVSFREGKLVNKKDLREQCVEAYVKESTYGVHLLVEQSPLPGVELDIDPDEMFSELHKFYDESLQEDRMPPMLLQWSPGDPQIPGLPSQPEPPHTPPPVYFPVEQSELPHNGNVVEIIPVVEPTTTVLSIQTGIQTVSAPDVPALE